MNRPVLQRLSITFSAEGIVLAVSLQDGHNPKITRYHDSVAGCLEAATVMEQRRGPGEIVFGFYHAVECGDPAGRMSCWGGCDTPNELTAEGAA
jgi:hypothetical protein